MHHTILFVVEIIDSVVVALTGNQLNYQKVTKKTNYYLD